MKRSIQVVMCRSCFGPTGTLDVDRLMQVAADAPYVGSAIAVDVACDKKTIGETVGIAREKGIDRLIAIPCHKNEMSPALFQAYARRAKINEFLMEGVNLVGEAVLPHGDEPAKAQAKAEARLLAAIARMAMLEPLEMTKEDMRTRNVVILGGGAAGIEAASAASAFSAHTIIIEKTDKNIDAPGVVMPRSRLVSAEGHSGNYVLTIEAGEKTETLECAAIIVASGGDWSDAEGPIVDAAENAEPLYRLEERLTKGDFPEGTLVIMDTPDPRGDKASSQDFSWEEALECASEVRKRSPNTEVYLIFQEMRAFGLAELAYKQAAELGVRFVRYDMRKPPKVNAKDRKRLTVTDMAQEETLSISFDRLYYASICPNPDGATIAEALRIPMSPSGGVRRGSMQRGPVTTPRPGIFVCGSAKFPKARSVAELEGRAAGVLAGQYVASGAIEFGGSVAQVSQEKCSACLTCVRTCPYEAPFIGAAGKAEIALQMCQGCGMCAGICPSKAIELRNHTDEQIGAETSAYLGGDF